MKRKNSLFADLLFVFFFFFTFTCPSTFVFASLEDVPPAEASYTTAQQQADYTTKTWQNFDPAMKPAPYKDFTSLRPGFAEEPLDEDDPIELTRMDVERVYEEFRNTIVSPPDPKALADPAAYKIDDARGSYEKCAELCRNINKLIFSVTDRSVQVYGPFLQAMRDVVYLDALCLKEYAEGNVSHRDLWYDLHNKWMSAVGERYAALGVFAGVQH